MKKVLLISSSGGHLEQLKCLEPLNKKYNCCLVTEKTKVKDEADHYIIQTGHRDKYVVLKMMFMCIQELYIFVKENPDVVITTGTIVALPIAYLCKFFHRKFIYIESFAKRTDPTKSGWFIYKNKLADLFIIQWESLKEVYPDAVYGGCIY